MKAKYLWLGMALAAAAGGLWLGRAAWRAHQQLVTLQVHNVPLAEVLRKIERQTWKKLRAERNVDARITLNVVNQPLSYVLDRLAEQAGARWATVYAVYDSSRALRSLESALRGDGKFESAGWSKIAPKMAELKFPGPERLGQEPGPNPEVRELPPDFPGGRAFTVTEDKEVKGAAGTKPGVEGGPIQGGPVTLRVVKRGGPGGSGAIEEEVWSPEELLVESALKPRLGDQPTEGATATDAADTAQKVKAWWTTYLAFRKSPLGIGFGGIPMPRPAMRRIVMDPHGNGTNQPGTPPPLPGNLEDLAGQERNDHFARLTPEQRVQRARERLQTNQK